MYSAVREWYRSGHNEAVLKTVCPKGRMGSNPIHSAEKGKPGIRINIGFPAFPLCGFRTFQLSLLSYMMYHFLNPLIGIYRDQFYIRMIREMPPPSAGPRAW